VVGPSHHRDAQNNYDLEKINVESFEWSGPLNTVKPQKNYNLEKINSRRQSRRCVILGWEIQDFCQMQPTYQNAPYHPGEQESC
jgi:thymidylate synthase